MLTSVSSPVLSANFYPEIKLDERFNYSCCLVDFSLHNANHNRIRIIEGENRFLFEVTDSSDSASNIVLKPRIYTLKNISDEIQMGVKKFYDSDLSLSFDKASRRCIIKTERTICIDFSKEGSIGPRLGFDRKKYCGETTYVAHHSIIGYNNIDHIRVNCDLVGDRVAFNDGVSTHTLHEFHPKVIPIGFDYKITEQPKNLIYLPVTRRQLNSVHVTLTDQYDNPIQFYEGDDDDDVYAEKDGAIEIRCLIHIKQH